MLQHLLFVVLYIILGEMQETHDTEKIAKCRKYQILFIEIFWKKALISCKQQRFLHHFILPAMSSAYTRRLLHVLKWKLKIHLYWIKYIYFLIVEKQNQFVRNMLCMNTVRFRSSISNAIVRLKCLNNIWNALLCLENRWCNHVCFAIANWRLLLHNNLPWSYLWTMIKNVVFAYTTMLFNNFAVVEPSIRFGICHVTPNWKNKNTNCL